MLLGVLIGLDILRYVRRIFERRKFLRRLEKLRDKGELSFEIHGHPYRSLFGETPSDCDWENVSLAMTAQLCRAEQAFLLIDAYPNPALREILANILYLGLPATARRLTCRKDACEPSPSTTDSNGKVSIDHE